MRRFTPLLLSLLFVAMSTPLSAQVAGVPNVEERKEGEGDLSPSVRAVEDVALAVRLGDYGQHTGDPVALIAAARILALTGPRPLAAPSDSLVPPPGEKDRPRRIGPDSVALLEAARDLGGGIESVDALIAGVQALLPDPAEGARGGTDGPATTIGRALAGATDVWDLGAFRGGEPARAIVDGDGDTDLDCFLYDDGDNLIASDDDPTDYCVLSWKPGWTGRFTLHIENTGALWNEYVVTTN